MTQKEFKARTPFLKAKTMGFERYVPSTLRGRFTAAHRGSFGYWFEFDGTVSFHETGGGGQFPLRIRRDS